MPFTSSKTLGVPNRPITDPDAPALIHGIVPVDHPAPRSDGTIKIVSTQWFRLFEGAIDIPETTKLLVLYGAMAVGLRIKIFVGSRITYIASNSGDPAYEKQGYWSIPFSTSENIDIHAESAADPSYLSFAFR